MAFAPAPVPVKIVPFFCPLYEGPYGLAEFFSVIGKGILDKGRDLRE